MENSLDVQVPRLLHLKSLPPELRFTEWWIISVPPDKDVIWSIVLAYLISFTSSGSSGARPIRRLLDRRTVNKAARHCVQEYNPFISSRRGVCSESMAEIVDQFGKRIEEYVKMNPNLFKSMEDSHKKLKAASHLLSSNILLHCQRKSPGNAAEYSSQWFPEEIPLKGFHTTLILLNGFTETENGALYDSFSFLLPEQKGRIKQKLALREILEKTKVGKDKISRICELENIGQDFICCLLESNFADNIPLIYKSQYVISKLEDAQFLIDPRQISKSTGESALYHAFQLQRTDLLYFLYNQAVCNCYPAQISVRSPDSTIMDNLLCMKRELASMRDKDVVKKDSYLRKLDELSRFNEFQYEVCGKMSVLNTRETNTTMEEAEKAKDVILYITQTYVEYFNWTDADVAIPMRWLELFQTFCQHKDYFDSVDFCSAVMFFDNIHHLKERLCLPDKCISKIESQFFNFVYCRKYYDVNVLNETSNPRSIILPKVIIFQERKFWERNLKEFQKALLRTIVSNKNVRERIPQEEAPELTDQVHIYGQVLLFRLQHYLDAAVSVSLKSPTATHAILRALQVLGECVKHSDFKSIQKILTLSLPASLVSELKKIRNHLSHLKPCDLVYRECIEDNVMLLKDIQMDLKTLKNLLAPIFSSHKHTMELFDLIRSLKAVSRLLQGNIPKKEWNSLEEILKEILPLPKSGENIKESKRKIRLGYFKVIRNSLVSKIKRSWSCRTIERNARYYKYLIRNLILNTTNKLSLEKSNKGRRTQKTESIESIQIFFWSTEFLLKHLIKDKLLIKHRREVLNLIKHREDYFEEHESLENKVWTKDAFVEFIEKAENFMAHYIIFTDEIFRALSVTEDEEPNFPGITNVCLMLKGKMLLSDKEKKIIRESVKSDFKDIHVAKENVIDIIKGVSSASNECLSVLMDYLKLSSSQKEDVFQSLKSGETANALDVVSNIKDVYEELDEILKKDTVNKKQFDDLTKKIDFPKRAKSLLEKLVEGKNIKGNKISFLIERIKSLEKCLIHSNKEVENIWKNAKSERKKAYLSEKMSELYINEPALQASIEMLLFDCMNILESKELEHLWKKSERLFKGLYLRNLLAHGKPILEVMGKFLDPEDLPSEIVSKVMQLIGDKNALNSILKMYESCNQNFTEVCRVLEDEDDVQFVVLREEIRKCERWKAFVKLLPRNHAAKE